MQWLRWYHGTISDPKWRWIAKQTGEPVAHVVAVWAALLENASESPIRGTLHNWSDEVTAMSLDLEAGTVSRICNAMCNASVTVCNGSVTDVTDVTNLAVTYRIAAWEKRNPKRERKDFSSERVKRFRERQRQEHSVTAAVTPCNAMKRPEQNRTEQNIEEPPIVPQIAKSETWPEEDKRVLESQKETPDSSSLPGIPIEEKKEKPRRGFDYDPEFEQLWAAYPNHNGKGAAYKAWLKAKKNGLPPLFRLLEIIERAKRSKQWTKDNGEFIPMLATWLNQHRWDDDYEPARAVRGVVC